MKYLALLRVGGCVLMHKVEICREYKAYYKTTLGTICITAVEEAVTGLYFAGKTGKKENGINYENAMTKQAYEEVVEYLAGKRKSFTVPILLKGSTFQLKVWNALLEIPYGETRSYKEIAESVGNPKAYRAVGGANNKNNIMILIPCHRVIGRDGSLVGFGGGLEVKEKLLDLEKRI